MASFNGRSQSTHRSWSSSSCFTIVFWLIFLCEISYRVGSSIMIKLVTSRKLSYWSCLCTVLITILSLHHSLSCHQLLWCQHTASTFRKLTSGSIHTLISLWKHKRKNKASLWHKCSWSLPSYSRQQLIITLSNAILSRWSLKIKCSYEHKHN